MFLKKETNEYLMAAFQQSMEEKVFEKLVLRLTPSAISMARSMLKRRSLAEDAVQDAGETMCCPKPR